MKRTTAEANYSLLGVMGDVHGDTLWTTMAIDAFAELGVSHILQLGDFGVWPGDAGEAFLQAVNSRLAVRAMLMVVTLGNHENYARLGAELRPSLEAEGFDELPGYSRILFARRGQRWSWNGVDFCSLGGANSIDRYSRKPSVNWWPEESISLGDAYRTISGGRADIMLTHDCPQGIPIVDALESHSDGRGWSDQALDYARESRDILRFAVDAVQPELLLHGHYHVKADLTEELLSDADGSSYTLRSVCLSKERSTANLALLEPSTRKLIPYEDWTA